MTEFGFIDHIRTLFAALPDNGFEGIGDDCAVLPLQGGESLLFTADLLTEGVHFLRHATTARELQIACRQSERRCRHGGPPRSDAPLHRAAGRCCRGVG